MAPRVLAWVLAIVFIMAGLTKLVGQQQAVEGFHHLGYSDEFRLVIGALEVIGAIGILSPWGVAACGLLAGIMVGAAVTLFRVGENVLPPLIVGTLLLVLLVVRRRAVAAPGVA